jgi:siroheme synthase (precorrin-2 oxidase/ferrochelatase)
MCANSFLLVQKADMRGRIDTSIEDPLTLSELAYAVKTKRRKEIHTRTIRRWIEEGLKQGGGEVIYMDRIKIGGVLHSSLEAYDRFNERLTGE